MTNRAGPGVVGMRRAQRWSVGLALAALLVNAGCVGDTACVSASDCPGEESCLAGVCSVDEDAGADTETDTETPDSGEEEEIYVGSLTLKRASDVANARTYTEITGDLTFAVDVDPITWLELPNLQRVGGTVSISNLSTSRAIAMPELTSIGGDFYCAGNWDVRSLSLPALDAIGGDLNISNIKVEDFEMPALRQVGGFVFLGYNTTTASIRLPALEQVELHLALIRLSALDELSLDALTWVGESLHLGELSLAHAEFPELREVGGKISIADSAELQTLAMPRLHTQGALWEGDVTLSIAIYMLPKLTTLDLGELELASGSFSLFLVDELREVQLNALTKVGGNLAIAQNALLRSVALPALDEVDGDLEFRGNATLSTISVPVLGAVQNLKVSDNPELPTCQATALRDRLDAQG